MMNSHATAMVYYIENKCGLTDVLKEYIEEVEAKQNSRVYKIRCDNKKEYDNGIHLTSGVNKKV